MMEMAAKDIEKLGGTVELVDIGKQKVRVLLLHCKCLYLFVKAAPCFSLYNHCFGSVNGFNLK